MNIWHVFAVFGLLLAGASTTLYITVPYVLPYHMLVLCGLGLVVVGVIGIGAERNGRERARREAIGAAIWRAQRAGVDVERERWGKQT